MLPDYLLQHYRWAYIEPAAVRFFERPWLTNLILWGQYRRLAEGVLAHLEAACARPGKTLQIACVYGQLTPRLLARCHPQHALTVADVLPVQLDNLRRKLHPGDPAQERLALLESDARALPLASGSQDQVLLFFLLHEQPDDARRATLAEAVRVLRPGGKLVIADYHRPAVWHPANAVMRVVFRWLEPDALPLWQHPFEHWLPGSGVQPLVSEILFDGLYQIRVFTRT